MDGGFELEDVVADGQVVFQPEGRKEDSVADGERQSQLVVFCQPQTNKSMNIHQIKPKERRTRAINADYS